ncbi:hypothetical protein AAY473_036747 [Plecturocebus cupreus]
MYPRRVLLSTQKKMIRL